MPNSLKCKIKHLRHNGTLTEREYDRILKALEQEPCEDCISREAVDEYITNLLSGYLYDEERTRLEDLSAFVWELPSVIPKYTDEEIDKAQAVEQAYVDKMVELAVEETKRPTGKWIDIGDEGLVFKCSLCGMKTTIESHYCPNCGAKMAESEVVE